MPIYFLRRSMPDTNERRRARHTLSRGRALLFAAGMLTLGVAAAPSQMLAHPNWAGNGMSTDPWWKHAVIYRVESTPAAAKGTAAPQSKVDWKYLTSRINALRSLGVDAILLPAPEIPGGVAGAPASAAAGPGGDLDGLDELVRAASLRGVRVLLTLRPSPNQDVNGIARFWLSRGVAGFYVGRSPNATPEENQATVQLLRHITGDAVGQRIVLSGVDEAPAGPADDPPSPDAAARRRRAQPRTVRAPENSPELQIDRRFAGLQIVSAGSLRSMLSGTEAQPNVLLEMPAPAQATTPATAPGGTPHSLAEVLAAIALTTHPSALISSDVHLDLAPTPDHAETPEPEQQTKAAPPPPPPGVYLPFKPYVPPSKKKATEEDAAPKDPLTAWYKQLATLHHTNAAVRAADPVYFDFDQQNALVWVERPAAISNMTPAVVVACNLSGSQISLSLRGPLESAGLRGNYLRTLLRSDKAMGPQDLNTVIVPPFGVYIGELRR